MKITIRENCEKCGHVYMFIQRFRRTKSRLYVNILRTNRDDDLLFLLYVNATIRENKYISVRRASVA